MIEKNHQHTIDKIYEILENLRTTINDLPESTSKTIVKQALSTLHRTAGKLSEDLVCDICGKNIEEDAVFYYKQKRHMECHIIRPYL